jgi:hypothetical protein
MMAEAVSTGEQDLVKGHMRKIGQIAGEQVLRLMVVGSVALALAACSKCDVPIWHRDSAPAPQSCHDDTGVK